MSIHTRTKTYRKGGRLIALALFTLWSGLVWAAAPTQSANTSTAATKSETDQKKLDITFRSDPTPPVTGENKLEVTVKDAAGKPVADADVSVAFRMPAMPQMNMPEMKNSVPLKHQTAGVYRGAGNVMMAGGWEVTVVVKRGGKEIGSKKFNVTAK
jgi:nitrogen fixation protein FixH